MSTLTWETYARLLAHLSCRRGTPLSAILAELGIDADELQQGEPALREELAGAWTNRKGILAMKLASALGVELRRLGAVGGDGAPALVGQAPDVPVADQPRETNLPSYLQPASPLEQARDGVRPALPKASPWAVALPIHRPPSSLVSTVAVSADSPATAAMPFTAPAASPSEAFPQEVALARATQGAPDGRARAVGSGTVGVGDEVAAPPLPPGVADLTVQQYASLRVELHMKPDRIAAILERYGVSPEGREGLDAYWRARFEADPLLRMMFARAYAEYVAWLKANPGS
jgi:hypothetical protein